MKDDVNGVITPFIAYRMVFDMLQSEVGLPTWANGGLELKLATAMLGLGRSQGFGVARKTWLFHVPCCFLDSNISIHRSIRQLSWCWEREDREREEESNKMFGTRQKKKLKSWKWRHEKQMLTLGSHINKNRKAFNLHSIMISIAYISKYMYIYRVQKSIASMSTIIFKRKRWMFLCELERRIVVATTLIIIDYI